MTDPPPQPPRQQPYHHGAAVELPAQMPVQLGQAQQQQQRVQVGILAASEINVSLVLPCIRSQWPEILILWVRAFSIVNHRDVLRRNKRAAYLKMQSGVHGSISNSRSSRFWESIEMSLWMHCKRRANFHATNFLPFYFVSSNLPLTITPLRYRKLNVCWGSLL